MLNLDNIEKDLLLVVCSFIAGWYFKYVLNIILNKCWKKDDKK